MTHIEKVKSFAFFSRHRYRSDADVVGRLAGRGHFDGKGEVLRETRFSRELESQRNYYRHIAPLPVASINDLGEDFSGEECPVEPEAHRGCLGGKSRFHHFVNRVRVSLDHVRGVGALDDLARGHDHCQIHL